MKFAIATCFLTILLFLPITFFAIKISDKILVKSIYEKYPAETIIYKFKPSIFITLILPFLMCAFPVCVALPYLLINEIINFNTSMLIIFIFVFMVLPLCIFSVMIHNLFKIIITNKRITNGKSNSLFFKDINFLLTDIKKLEWCKPDKTMLVTFKNDKIFIFGQFTVDEKLYEKLKKLINKSRDIDK